MSKKPLRNRKIIGTTYMNLGLPRWLSGEESACHAEDAGDLGSIPGWGRFPGGGHDNPLQYSCLENPMDRGAWWALVHRVAQSQTRLKQLNTNIFNGFPSGSEGKESACNAGDLGLIPQLGRSPGGGHDNPLQYSCLENPHGQRSLAGYSAWDGRVIHI